MANFMLLLLYPWAKFHQYPLNSRLGGSHRHGHFGEEKNPCPFHGSKLNSLAVRL